MVTFTEVVAAVVVHTSAAAFSHFGVSLEPPQAERPPAERVVARTPRDGERATRLDNAASCPERHRV